MPKVPDFSYFSLPESTLYVNVGFFDPGRVERTAVCLGPYDPGWMRGGDQGSTEYGQGWSQDCQRVFDGSLSY